MGDGSESDSDASGGAGALDSSSPDSDGLGDIGGGRGDIGGPSGGSSFSGLDLSPEEAAQLDSASAFSQGMVDLDMDAAMAAAGMASGGWGFGSFSRGRGGIRSDDLSRNSLGAFLDGLSPGARAALGALSPGAYGLAMALDRNTNIGYSNADIGVNGPGGPSGAGGDGGEGGSMNGTPGSTQTGNNTGSGTNFFDGIFGDFEIPGMGDAYQFQMPTFNADPSGLTARATAMADRYDREFAPYQRKMMNQVDQYGSEDYQASQRGIRMADVQQQADMGYQTALRDNLRMGNPNGGRLAALQNQRAMATALGKVQAAASSDRDLRDTYIKGLGAVNSMGTDMAKTAQGWGQIGTDNAKIGATWGLGTGELGLKAREGDRNYALNWGKLGIDKYGIDKGVQMNSDKIDAAKEDNWWDIGGAFLGSLIL